MAEYDPKTGETKYPNETDQQRRAREERERTGQGQPDAEGETTEAQQKAANERKARGEHGTSHVSRGDAPDA